MLVTDARFDHSWTPVGPEVEPGWYSIPRGDLSLDIHNPARPEEIRQFGYRARRVQCLPLQRCYPIALPMPSGRWRIEVQIVP